MYIEIDSNYTLAVPQGNAGYPNSIINISVDTSGGPITINIPALTDFGGQLNQIITVKDRTGNAGTNPITITVGVGDDVNGGASFVINENGGYAFMAACGKTSWLAMADLTGSTVEIISKTVAQMQALGAFIPLQLYRITDTNFQSNPQAFIVRASDTGDALEPWGYLHIGGILYPAMYDLASDTFQRFVDPQMNNDISRALGSATNCVDNFPIGNPSYKNVTGREFNVTTTPANSSITNTTIQPDVTLVVSNNSDMDGAQIGSGAAVSLNNCTSTDTTYGANCSVVLTNGTELDGCQIGNSQSVTIATGNTYTDSRIDSGFSNFTESIDITTGEKINVPYDNLLNGPFVVGETVTDGVTGATGIIETITVATATTGTLKLNTLTGFFLNNNGLTGGTSAATADVNGSSTTADYATVVSYDNLAGGPFQFGEVVTNGANGATGTVISDNGTTLILQGSTGAFENNNALTGGTSGATADVNGNGTYTSIDLAAYGFAGIFTVTSSNANESISNIIGVNTSQHKVEFQPSAFNLSVVQNVSSGGNIYINKSLAIAPAAGCMKVLGAEKGFVEFVRRGTDWLQYNTILGYR